MKFILSKLSVIILLLFVFLPGRTQTNTEWKEIKGIVIEEQDTIDYKIEFANVFLLNPKDSAVIKHTSTNKSGYFLFTSVEQKDYLLQVAFIGYNTLYSKISPSRFPGEVANLGNLRMEENAILLSEVTIEGEIPEVVVKEDTLEYNPAAFKMQEGAIVEDLLKRLPGVEVETDGKISSMGKEIKRVFVDGKEFFGKDPKMATKNLTIDMIDKVQVIEKKSDQELLTGVEDGEEETIINLTIKKGMKKGWISNTTVGAGGFVNNPTDNSSARYSGNLLVSRFDDKSQITIIGNSNNINNQGFADTGNQVRSNMRGSRGGGSNGITNSSMAGVNIVREINDKLKMGGNFRYNYSDESVKQKSFRENILTDSVSYRKSWSDDQSYSNNYVFDYKIEYAPDSLNTFVLTTGLSYNSSTSDDHSFRNTLAGDKDSTEVNKSEAYTYSNSDGLKLEAELTYARKFSKKGRRFNITGSFSLDNNSGDGTNISNTEYVLKPANNKFLNQEMFNSSDRSSYSLRLSYVEPVWKTNNTIQFSYNIRYNRTNNIRETYDLDSITDTYSILNPDYSKSLRNNFVNQTFNISFNSVHTNYSYNIGFNIVPSYTQSTSYVKNGDMHGNDSILNKVDGRNVVNFSPQITYTQRFSKESNLRFTYRGNTRQPSVSQLDPTVNNTNPLNLRSGNPYLLPSFSNNLSLRYNNSNRKSQRVLTANLTFSFTRNEIINFTTYEDSTGIQRTKPINENGSWNSSADIMYNRPLDAAKKFKLSTNTRLSYNNRIGFITVDKKSERNISGTFNISENIGLSYSKDWFYGQFRGNIRYANTSNSLEGREDQKSANFGLTYNTQLTFPYNWSFASDFNYKATRGMSAGYNTDEFVWNAEISKQFLSKKQASLRIRWTDILQQALSINRNVTSEYIEDNEYNILTSYILVSFSYRFNQMGGRSGRNTGNREGGSDRGGRNFRESGGGGRNFRN